MDGPVPSHARPEAGLRSGLRAAGDTSRRKRRGAPGGDDLTCVAGVGPRIAALLNAAGVATLADLARAHPAWLRRILDQAGDIYRTHDPASWPFQAGLAASGRWSDLRELQSELYRGRRER